MSEYEAYWLMGFPLINVSRAPRIIMVIFKKQRNKYKENFVILQKQV